MTAEQTGAVTAADGPSSNERSDAAPTGAAAEVSGAARADGLWVERTGTRTYRGRNGRGAVVEIGPDSTDAVFSPGELMKLALAGCSGMTSDNSLSRRLGADVRVAVHVSGPSDPREVRYPALHEEMVVDLSALAERERDRLLSIVRRAIEKYCTVGRTLEKSAEVELTITSDVPPGGAAPTATVPPGGATPAAPASIR
jgi:uncharacterized OsmC-like protein